VVWSLCAHFVHLAPTDLAISLLQKHPPIMLIGINLTFNRMLMFSGEQSRLLTADDLYQVIEGRFNP
jgi:hypothetical protein